MVQPNSKHYDRYFSQVLEGKKAVGSLAKVYDIISDICDRRGLRQEWESIDADIQDEIIDKWEKIIDNK